MRACFFASDLHGRRRRYRALFAAVAAERPLAVFLGGDLLPHALADPDPQEDGRDFLADEFGGELRRLRAALGDDYPRGYASVANSCESAVRSHPAPPQ